LFLLSNKRLIGISLRPALIIVLIAACMPAFGAGITVGSGASFNLGSGNIDLNCLDLTTAGEFALGDGQLDGARLVSIDSGGVLRGDTGGLIFSGDWWNAGTFTMSQSSIALQDGCGLSSSLLLGDSDFYDFTASSLTGKTLSVEAGSTQTFANSLSLQGLDASQRLKIRSSVAGEPAFFSLAAQGTQQIYAVDVKDNDASGGQLLGPDNPAAIDSLNSGNNRNWFGALVDLIFSDSFESR
jgi:hypothetical protein